MFGPEAQSSLVGWDFFHPELGMQEGLVLMADLPEVMNIKQASHYLGISSDTLYKYVNEQQIPAFKLGNRWKFKKSLLDRWMDEKSAAHECRGSMKPRSARVATRRS